MADPAEDASHDTVFTGQPAGIIASMIARLARTHGITADRHPIDDFADAASRLCDAAANLDRIERLLVSLQRAGVLTSREAVALHVAYLREGGLPPIAQ